MLKSVLLAFIAGLAASRLKKASITLFGGVVFAYQTLGTLGEWILKDNLWLAIQDFRIGIPGMLLQVLGSWLFINHIIRK